MGAPNLFRNQTKGLLIRTYHWQRRQYCALVCNFVIPAVLLILLSVLQRVIKPPETKVFEFQQKPKGAFVPRPFDPYACRRFAAISPTGFQFCEKFPFFPEYVVPVYAAEAARALVGERDIADRRKNSGILSHFSLEPFIYPNASDRSSSFFKTQSPYDGVFLHATFDGDQNNYLYKTFLASAESLDERYNVRSEAFSSRDALYERLYGSWFKHAVFSNYSTALAFDSATKGPDGNLSVEATVFYNESTTGNCTESCPIIANVARTYDALYKELLPDKSAAVYLRRMPLTKPFGDLGIVQLIISIIIGLTTHFLLPTFLRFLVLERVGRMRSMMAIMGLRRGTYWFGTYISLLIKFLLTIITSILVGSAVRIPFYKLNAPIAYLALFFLWGNVLIALAMVIAPFFRSPETAQTVGWLFVILVNLIGGPYIGERLSNTETTEGQWSAIMLLPSFAYFRSLYYAGALNSGGKGVTVTSQLYRDVQLGMCSGRGTFCRSYLFLAWEWVLLMLLAAYFDRVLPTAQGTRLHPLFFLGKKRRADDGKVEQTSSSESEDVVEEEKQAQAIVDNIHEEPFDGVVLNKLTKTYPGKPPVQALRGLSLVAKRNEVLCILAHNGAGKTTMFRTLVGELTTTSGSAYVCGNSTLTDMDLVHRNMGVAPQQNILWDVMSVQEHLFFYGRVKNLGGSDLRAAVDESLNAVQLHFARNRRTARLSGGMKRRLSVSIAMIGKPQFVILDEPSTGLDILAREKLWEAIERLKEDRIVMLTTHSLEEAETLSSRVAIMSRGELKCIGSAEELKLRLGKGHHLNVSLPQTMVGAFHEELMQVAPESVIETELGGNLEYVLPRSIPIPEVFKFMERHRGRLQIRDWSINQATLEEVFLAVTKDSWSKEHVEEDAA